MKDKIDVYMSNPGNFGPEEMVGDWPTNPSKHFNWTKNKTDLLSIWVDTDGSDNPFGNLKRDVLSSPSKYKIMVLAEPKGYCAHNYEWVLYNHSIFDLVFSTYPEFGFGNKKFKYYHGGLRSYISKEDFGVYEKSKEICSVMSSRKQLPGHVLRHEIRSELEKIGNTFIDYVNPPLKRKVDGLRDYRYELVIENEDGSNFTEKLIDSILCGCLPIYWSDIDLSYLNVFDMNGIEVFRTKQELIDKLKSGYFTKELYDSKIDSIKNNFEVAKKFVSLGDVLWNYGLKELVETHENNL